MDPDAQRRRGDRTPGADAYWQRRFFTLVGGLAVIGLLAWACSGVASGGKSSHNSGSGGPSSAAYASTATATPKPSAPVTSAPASPSPSVSPSASPSKSATATPKPTASGKPREAPAKAAASAPVTCPAADLVLTVTASQASYGAKDTPTFQVDIVSTNAATCTLATGPEALKLVILHGGTTAWNSAACVRGAPRHVISLRRGVPVVTSMTWNKQQQGASGCGSAVAAATGRTYSAVAQAGGAQSPGAPFRLTAPAAKPASPATKSAGA